MKDYNKIVQIERFNLGKVDAGQVGMEVYRQGMEALKGLMFVGEGGRKLRVLDLHCSQSFVRDFVDKSVEYAGLDEKVNFERDGEKIVPDIQADINNIPLKDDSTDFIFAIGQNVGYGKYHKSVFEIERIIRPGGYLVVALTKYWFQKGFNQLLFCYRNWDYVKAVELNYKLMNGDETKDTSKYLSVYQYRKQ